MDFERNRIVANPLKTDETRGDQVTGTSFPGGKHALDVALQNAISGTLTPSGLKTDFVAQVLTITDTASAVPATALTARNHIIITNISNDVGTPGNIFIAKTASVNNSRVAGVANGKILKPGGIFSVDITDAIGLFAIAESGGSVHIEVLEIS